AAAHHRAGRLRPRARRRADRRGARPARRHPARGRVLAAARGRGTARRRPRPRTGPGADGRRRPAAHRARGGPRARGPHRPRRRRPHRPCRAGAGRRRPQRCREVHPARGPVPPGSAAGRHRRGRCGGAGVPAAADAVRGGHRARRARRLRRGRGADRDDAAPPGPHRAAGREPLRALLRTARARLRQEAAGGRCVILPTHALRAVAAADAVVVIADGTLEGPMPPAALLQESALLERAGLRAHAAAQHAAAAAPADDDAGEARADRDGPAGERLGGAGRAPAETESRGALARCNPTVLLALLTALSIVGIALTDPLPLLVLYLLLHAGAMLGCRLRPVALLRAQLPFAVFAGGVFMVNVL